MGRPSPALIVGGARRSLRAHRLPGPLRLVRLIGSAGSGTRMNGGHESSTNASHIGEMLIKELKIVEQSHNLSQTSATILPTSVCEAYEQHDVQREREGPERNQEVVAVPGEYERWAVYDATNPLSSKAVFKRKTWPHTESLQEGQEFYEEFNGYREHFKTLMDAEIKEITKEVVERLSQWPLERLISEGYTVDNLFAFPYRRKGEKRPSGYTFSFVPPAGGSLGVNLFMRGSQVSVVLHGESPLHCIDVAAPKVDTLQGIILYSSSEEIRINFKSRDLKFPAEDRWRLDVWVSAIGHERMRAAIDALNYDPNKMHADSSSVREYELHGTYLREELLGGCAQGLFGSSVPANTSTQPSSDLPTPRKGLFTSDERVDDWVRRHSLPEPERKEGDPELPLNTSQTRAVAQMIGERFSLVQGPPGTGKTRAIIEMVRILKAHFKVPYPLLVCTYTNAAVDNLVEGIVATGLKPLRVGSEASVREDLAHRSLHHQMQNHPDWDKLAALRLETDNKQAQLENLTNGLSPTNPEKIVQLRADLDHLKNVTKDLEKSMKYHILRSADVICTTCLTAGSRTLRLMDFPAVFLDEASMSTEPASLVPFMLGSQHVALIGDHKQLPPVIKSASAREGGLSLSLFERLMMKRTFPSVMLDTQYRMHPAISAFPSREFYGESLKNGTVSDTGAISSDLSPPLSRHLSRCTSKETGQVPSVLFIHHDHWETKHNRSRTNVYEMRIVAAILEDLLKLNPEMQGKAIGVIAPYVAQIRILDSILKTDLGWERYFRERLGDVRAVQMKEIEVKTVDGFEGREKDVMIFSTVRNNPWGHIGFLADRRRMNVALTRAKRALFVIGSMTTLSRGRYGSIGVEPAKQVASMMVQATGDEWKNFIQFVLAEELFTEYDSPAEYRSQEEIVEFQRIYNSPTQMADRALVKA